MNTSRIALLGAVALAAGAAPALAQHAGKSASAPGQLRQITASEAKALMAGMERFVSQSSEGLVAVRHANGAVAVDLQDRFQSVSLARMRTDGTVDSQCVGTPAEASSYLGLQRSPVLARSTPAVQLEEK